MDTSPFEIAQKFCELCNWAYECWITHRTLFDDNPNKEILNRKAPYFHEHLWHISHDYSFLQICKLHDPANSKATNSYNLSIRYIIDKLDWGDEKDSIKQLAGTLEKLYSRINTARNKVIAHNDLDVLLRGEPIGEFPEGLDIEYFQ
jgi:AbiU2